MPSHRGIATLGAILMGTISNVFGGVSLSQSIAMANDLDNIAPDSWTGKGGGVHQSNHGGARKYRAWKRRRASGLHARVRH